MGDPKDTTKWGEWAQGIGKFLVMASYIIAGAIAKLAFDSRGKDLSTKEKVIKFILSVFSGCVAWSACEAWHMMRFGPVIVPVVTLLGESLINHLMNNWKDWVTKIAPSWFSKKGKKEDSTN